ncbi:MAG: hypothetical protein P8X74_03750 [Reinekea sp.]
MEDLSIYKNRLAAYLSAKGHSPQKNGNYHCIAPDHADNDPSMTFYEVRRDGDGNFVNCNACGFKGDIFDCCRAITGLNDFKDQLEEIKGVLGAVPSQPQVKKPVKKQQKVNVVPVTIDKAREIFTNQRVIELGIFVLNHDKKTGKTLSPDEVRYKDLELIKVWPWKNKDGLIDIITARFDFYDKVKKRDAKDVITIYYNGKAAACKGYPVVLYNRDKLAANPGKPFIMVEGEKCVTEAEEKFPDYILTTWNGGGAKVKNIQGLEILKDRDGYLWPDDDTPGQKAMEILKFKLEAL